MRWSSHSPNQQGTHPTQVDTVSTTGSGESTSPRQSSSLHRTQPGLHHHMSPMSQRTDPVAAVEARRWGLEVGSR